MTPGAPEVPCAGGGGELAPRPPCPCRQRCLRAGLRNSVGAGAGEEGSEPDRHASLGLHPLQPRRRPLSCPPASACPPAPVPRAPGAAAGPDLPRALPVLLSPSPRPSGPPVSRPLPCPPAPSLAPTAPPCSHTGRSVPHAGLWLWAVALSPGWGAGPPLVPCSSHLEVPVHVEPWAGAWQGHKDSRAKGRGPLPCPPQSTRALGHGQNQELFLPLTSAVLQRPAVPTMASEKAQRAGHPVPGTGRAVRPHCTVGIFQGRRGLPGR